MKHRYHCFVRKNTEYIREGLKNLGIPQNDFDNGDRPWIAFNHGMWISVDEGHDRLFPDDIDCGTNDDLFLAIAALRDDSDINQWFIYDSMDCVVPELRDFYWFKCEEDKIEDMMYYDAMYLCCKKATVEELIEHFNHEKN